MRKEYPLWKQIGHFGGFSDDRFLGIRNSFLYAKGVEIRKNPNSLTLAYANEKCSGLVVTDLVLAMVTISTTGDVIAFADTGKIYRRTAGAGSWVNVYTMGGALKILSAFEFNGYLFWATAGYIHRILITNIDDNWSGDASLAINYKEFTVKNANSHPFIELSNKLYVGDGYDLAELDSLGVWTPEKIKIFKDEEIRAITFGGATMRIFSRKSTKLEGGHKYYWDGTNEAYIEKVYCRQVIHCAISNGGKDYVIAGRRPFLYDADGYDWNPIKRLPLVYDNENCYLSPNAIDYYDNLVAFGVAESGNASIPRGVWTWGQEDYKYPQSLNFEYPTSNDNVTDIIGCVHNSNGVLYSSWRKIGTPDTFGIDVVNTAKYRAAGELQSLVHYGDEAEETKNARSFKMAFDTLKAGEKIQVYLRKNLAATWEAAVEIEVDYARENPAGTYPDRNKNDRNKDVATAIGDYNFLETKILLTAGTSQLTTPELISLSVEFDEQLEIA